MVASGASPHFMQLYIYYHQHSSAKASEGLSGDRTDTSPSTGLPCHLRRAVQSWVLAWSAIQSNSLHHPQVSKLYRVTKEVAPIAVLLLWSVRDSKTEENTGISPCSYIISCTLIKYRVTCESSSSFFMFITNIIPVLLKKKGFFLTA